MEETSTATFSASTKKKNIPLSLNQRIRLLSKQPPPLPPSSSSSSSLSSRFLREEDDQPRFNLDAVDDDDDDDDFPRFSSIADFDCSSDVANLPEGNAGGDGEKDDTSDETAFNFSSIAHLDSRDDAAKLPEEIIEGDGEKGDTNDESAFNFSAIADVDSRDEKPKVQKVKIQGRRRLCKLSTQNDDHEADHAKEESSHIFDVSDFSSPPPPKDVGGGGPEIRDILNDLSSRLEFLSIEKKKPQRPGDLKAAPLVDEFSEVVEDTCVEPTKVDLAEHEYASAGSSFGGSSDQSSSSSGVVDTGVGKERRNETFSDSDGYSFAEVTKPDNNFSAKAATSVSRNVIQKPVVSHKHSAYNFKDLRESSDQSSSSFGVVDTGVGKERRNETFSDSDGYTFAEVTKPDNNFSAKAATSGSRNVQKPVVSHKLSAYNFKDQRDKDKVFEVNKPTKNVPRKDPRDVSRTATKKSAVSHKKSAYDFLVNNDEDDCTEVGSHGWKRAEQWHDSAKNKGRAISKAVEVLDDEDEVIDDDDAVLGDDHTIVMKDPRSTYKLPAKIGKMLYPHQRDGLKWLWSLHCQGKGGILGDDMGLGKTMQIAGYLAGMFNSRLINRAMIVAPKTLIPHWIKELTVVGLSKMIKEYFGTCPKLRQYELQFVLQDKGILLTTYDIVRNNTKQLCGSGFYDEDNDDSLWDYMILDEGHLIKNPSTQRAKSLLQIPCAHRIIISGTPIQNNLKELWALFNFCCPDLLGDKQFFKEKYENPILRGNDKKASERDKRIGSMVAKELRERIQPYFLRRMKNEVFCVDGPAENAQLSQKNELIVWLQLTSSQRHLYEAFLKSEIVLSAFDGSPLAAITILKKICDHPYLLTKRAAEDLLEGMDSMLNQEDRGLAEKLATHAADLTDEDDFQEKQNVSCKISFILSLLEKLIPEGHKVLIFSQTRKMLNLIQESLVTHGFEFLRIDGTTKANDRLKIVNEFQEGHGAPIFMLTSQVGGLGLTLTNADRVIVVDPAWNPSTDNQSVDRAYRIGQKKDVIVYRLITCGTIEEKMYRMQVFKGGLFKTATEHKEQTRYFTQQDLKELFSLPKDGFDVSPTQLQLHEEHGDQISLSDYLKDHIKLLESFGIGGVSDHSLLYSKSDPTPKGPVEEEETWRKANTFNRHFGGSSTDRPVDGSQHAFKPKDVNVHKVNSSPKSPDSMSESEIKDRIRRLSQLLSNKATVSKLPDKGEKLRKQMSELAVELENLVTPDKSNEIMELDDIADKMHSYLRI
ncbi:hypothetical protein vseg_008368 [Gypsophila vaccaria]